MPFLILVENKSSWYHTCKKFHISCNLQDSQIMQLSKNTSMNYMKNNWTAHQKFICSLVWQYHESRFQFHLQKINVDYVCSCDNKIIFSLNRPENLLS